MTAPPHASVRREERRAENREQALEPWAQLGKYIRDAKGRIVLSGKRPADARRVVACVNALMGVPTETVERWNIQVFGGAGAGPDPALASIPAGAVEAIEEFVGSRDRRLGERRRADRRRAEDP